MKEWAELIHAVAALLWPILLFVVVLAFGGQIRTVLGRLRRGKVLGQEIELEAIQVDSQQRLLASSVVLTRIERLLSSPELEAKLTKVVASPPGADSTEIVDGVLDVLRSTTSDTVKEAFVTLDSVPLLGARGGVWEEPYDPSLSVRLFLNNIYFEMRPHVRAFTYPDGWVLRDRKTGVLFTAMGRPWAHTQGLSEDERSLQQVGIGPGAMFEVVPGTDPSRAFVQSPHDWRLLTRA
jgi:hypothetical protein